jgi:hypothetical protein
MGVSFVDDTSLRVISNYEHEPSLKCEENTLQEIDHLVKNLQRLAQHWEKLLFSTGVLST